MKIQSVAITGTMGNLGGKLIRFLAQQPGYTRLVGLDIVESSAAQRADIESHVRHGAEIALYAADLSDWQDRRWHDALGGVEALVHFAAQNPEVGASWTDAAVSYNMTLNLVRSGMDTLKRFVFASSNHVMGGYKDRDLGPGELTTELEVAPGTIWDSGSQIVNSTAYAVQRAATEWLLDSLAKQAPPRGRSGPRMSSVCVRIGWCQPGENLPSTLSAAGSKTMPTPDTEQAARLASSSDWFRGMWLSNRDFYQIFERALQADASQWPQPAIIVNGVSNNSGMQWSLDTARRYLGYQPQDDVNDPVWQA